MKKHMAKSINLPKQRFLIQTPKPQIFKPKPYVVKGLVPDPDSCASETMTNNKMNEDGK